MLHGGSEAQAGPDARRGPLQVLALVDGRPSSAARGALDARLGSLSAVAPAWAEVAPGGFFRPRLYDGRLRDLGARGARIVPIVRDPDANLPAVLADDRAANRLARRLAAGLRAGGHHAVFLDLATVPASARATYPTFVRTLSRLLGPGAAVYVGVPAVSGDDEAARAAGYDLRDLARPAWLVVASFDEHAEAGRPGPVASLDWYRDVVRWTLGQAPRSKVLLGVPTYGRRWVDGEAPVLRSQAEVFPRLTESDRLAEDGASVRAGQAEEWVETDRSVELKLRVAVDAQVAGVAVWLRGGESTRQWRAPLLGVPPGARR
jgi:hypothetical protein